MGSIQYPSGTGLRVVTSGELIGMFSEFLRLKRFVKERGLVTPKTAERYFKGMRVEPESVDAILDSLIGPLLSEHLVEAAVFGESFNVAAWARQTVADLANRWDRLIGELSSGYFPIVSVTDSPLPFLRMVALDMGIRWGAYQALRASLGREPLVKPSWLAEDALRLAIDEERGQAISVEKLSENVGVSMTAMSAWRTGEYLPTETNLDELATQIAVATGKAKDTIKARLRLAVGVSVGWHRLAASVSHKGHVVNLVMGFEVAAKRSLDFFKWLPLPLDKQGCVEALRAVVASGARSVAGAAACAHLVSLAETNQEVAADIRALSGEWTARINYWFQQLGTVEPAANMCATRIGLPPAAAQELTKTTLLHMMTMTDFDRSASHFAHSYVVTGDDAFKATNRMAQAVNAWSSRNFAEALDHLQRAIQLQPANAYYRLAMGAWIGELVEAGQVQFLDLALAHLGEAMRLDPADRVAATEIGIVFCNAGLLNEAELAFAEVETVSSGWHHFHEMRGINAAWLGRYDEAEKHLRRAVELEPKDLHAKKYLALVLMRLGGRQREKEAKALAREVDHRSAANTLDGWEKKLSARPNQDIRWTVTPEGWVPSSR